MRNTVMSFVAFGFAGTAWAGSNGLPEQTVVPGDDVAEVIGGTLAPVGKWPDTVAVLGNQGSCSGTLIAPDVVLTAGHCAMGMTRVIANTLDYNAGGGQQATIKSITAYPSWETTYDVSVIVLTTPITGVTPRPIGTACTFSEFSTKPSVQLVGFGLTDPAGMGNNTKLYEVRTGVTDADCTTAGAGCQTAVAPGGEFIAGGNNKDSCFGDSGGPVYLTTPRGVVVIGAVSRGLDSATTPCGGGGIYVRTDKVVQWIEQTTGKTVSKDLCATSPDPTDPTNPDPTNPDPTNPTGPGGNDNDVTGGCASTTGGGAGLALLALGLALVIARRRR